MGWVKKTVALAGLLLLSAATWLWLTLLSPWLYSPPDEVQTVEQRTHQLFVYGTLRYPLIRWLVAGSLGSPEPAVLPGYQRHDLDVAPQPGSHVEGLKLTVTPEALRRLDRYERLGVRYERVKKRLADGSDVWVYVRLPETSYHLLKPSPAKYIALIP
ncbi:gamma-glutamylcyclotransferase family protein [Halomonas sp.]|uniref:gamma-glutamylcyclotransferase family protein n=1 Tax=unclassified Halomonas TaxID=2609666 RepID=UPI003F913A8E